MIVVNSKSELIEIINRRIEEQGFECNLNDIDVSKVTDLSGLFYKSEFNGNISQWDVSNVKSMKEMFQGSRFKGDLSKWNVSRVEDMS